MERKIKNKQLLQFKYIFDQSNLSLQFNS